MVKMETGEQKLVKEIGDPFDCPVDSYFSIDIDRVKKKIAHLKRIRVAQIPKRRQDTQLIKLKRKTKI